MPHSPLSYSVTQNSLYPSICLTHPSHTLSHRIAYTPIFASPTTPHTLSHRIEWLWRQATGLYPSIYLSNPNQTTTHKHSRVRREIAEAVRIQNNFSPPNTPIYPYSNIQQGANIFFQQVGSQTPLVSRVSLVLLCVLHAVLLCVLHAVLLCVLHAVLLCVLHAVLLCVLHAVLLCVLHAVLLCVLHAVLLCVLHAVLLCVLHAVLLCVLHAWRIMVLVAISENLQLNVPSLCHNYKWKYSNTPECNTNRTNYNSIQYNHIYLFKNF